MCGNFSSDNCPKYRLMFGCELLGEPAHYHLMLTVMGYVEQQRKCYTLTRLDVGHEKSLDCGMHAPLLAVTPFTDCCSFELKYNLIISESKKETKSGFCFVAK